MSLAAPAAPAKDLLLLSEVGTLVGRAGIGLIPVCGPLPDIPGHVHRAVGARPRFEGADWQDVPVTGIARIQLFIVVCISPRELSPVGAARRFFPLRLGRKAL